MERNEWITAFTTSIQGTGSPSFCKEARKVRHLVQKEVRPSLLANAMTIYVKISGESTKQLLELVSYFLRSKNPLYVYVCSKHLENNFLKFHLTGKKTT